MERCLVEDFAGVQRLGALCAATCQRLNVMMKK